MHRKESWPEDLNRAIDKARPFREHIWGKLDCLFVADCIEAMTGEDPAKELRGYSDAAGAYAALQRYAGGGLLETLDKMANVYGWQRVTNPSFAQRGDVVLLASATLGADPRFGGVASICIGPMLATISESGLLYLPLHGARAPEIIACWHFD